MIIKKNEIKEILMSKQKMILYFINKIYSIINQFEVTLKNIIIKDKFSNKNFLQNYISIKD